MRASLAALLSLLFPAIASAHEVYVLTPAEIRSGLATPSFNEAAVAWGDLNQFLFWAFVAALTIFVVFGISILRPLERRLDPALARLRPYAARVARVTIGVSFIAAAYYQALFGPELPLGTIFGAWAGAVTVLLIVLGVLITFGLYVRAAALAALCLFGVEIAEKGLYMLTYANYLGEILVLLILGTHHGVGPAARNAAGAASRVAKRLAPYSFALLRVCFGTSLFYASFYAKILHNNLALQVAALPLAGHAHSLAYAFGLEPHFLVLGAAIVELVIATFFILGIEIRFTSLFLLFWLSLSLWYFGEVVWPHIILIGIPIAFIC
ncbi:MAG: hypothetical protein KGI78_04640, partial [Patescibacteria group bacterium]|nr:hypothetical protein [Patescibacteria group bacterium]